MLSVFTLMALAIAGSITFAAKMDVQTSSTFQGPKANTGTVSRSIENGKSILRVSADFKVPDTPAPTWRVVDSKGSSTHSTPSRSREARSAKLWRRYT